MAITNAPSILSNLRPTTATSTSITSPTQVLNGPQVLTNSYAGLVSPSGAQTVAPTIPGPTYGTTSSGIIGGSASSNAVQSSSTIPNSNDAITTPEVPKSTSDAGSSDVVHVSTTTESTTKPAATPTPKPEPEPEPEPEAPTYSNISTFLGAGSGSGLAAAEGVNYAWQQQAADRAEISYKQDVLQAKQDALANRQQIEQNAATYQNQSDMQKYIDNQSIEKAGWTGGYVLDSNRQREYLKASIQAAMYNSMELQKYGYTSQLEAARLAYDANMMDLALEYYNTAVQNALQEASVTGVYISAEAQDHLAQLNTAYAALENGELSDDEKERAQKIIDQVNTWFSVNNISKEGQKTLAMYQYELSQMQMQNGIYEATLSRIENSPGTFIMSDASGQPIIDGVTCKTINLYDASSQDIYDWLNSGDPNAESQIMNFFQDTVFDMFYNYNSSLPNGIGDEQGLRDYMEGDSTFMNLLSKLKQVDGFSDAISKYMEVDSKGNTRFSKTIGVTDKDGNQTGSNTYSLLFNNGEFKWNVDSGVYTEDGDFSEDDPIRKGLGEQWSGSGTTGSIASSDVKVSLASQSIGAKLLADIKSGTETDVSIFAPNIEGANAMGYAIKTTGKTYSASSNASIYQDIVNACGTNSVLGDLCVLEDSSSKYGFYVYVCGGNGVWACLSTTNNGSSAYKSAMGGATTMGAEAFYYMIKNAILKNS